MFWSNDLKENAGKTNLYLSVSEGSVRVWCMYEVVDMSCSWVNGSLPQRLQHSCPRRTLGERLHRWR